VRGAGRSERPKGSWLLVGSIDPDLSAYDYVVIPGGTGVRDLVRDRDFLSWISVGSETTRIAAVCGGVLLAGAAGMLRGRRATTHPGMQEFLKSFAAEVVGDRIVEDGNVITAGGVTAAIDLGLYLCEKIAGPGVREKIQKQMDYRNYATK
jgi:transcriptional regulator GlxA family with amidase domain